MKKIIIASAALVAFLAAEPASAWGGGHRYEPTSFFSFGWGTPAPVYPAPTYYYPPRPVYYTPAPYYNVHYVRPWRGKHYVYERHHYRNDRHHHRGRDHGRGHDRGHGRGHDRGDRGHR